MPEITILTERELRECVTLDLEAVDIVEEAFAALARGGVVMPPVLSMAIEAANGEVDVKTAYVPGLDGFAVKVSPGFFDNPGLGLPSLSGLMVVLDARTGVVKAVLLDNGYLTDIRTAAAGAVAARHLAPREVRTAGVIGAGVQAELQARALRLVRPFEELVVWARDREKAKRFADRMAGALGCRTSVADDAAECVRRAQAVVTTTPARTTVLEADWLHPGLHVTAMGSDAPEKNELAPEVLKAAGRVVVDRLQQSLERGELRSAKAAGRMPDGAIDEIGEICAGLKPGRRSEDEVTICDLTGTGVQDTAIANRALQAARARGFGTPIEA
ncbi:cyclodeaminase [Lutibaculum baratangense]|uniref:Ornithine cyclodeaminase n=1 Tax=Lutibaculum baratangense AMV1 TaxID=631454 RepID=V4RMX1_9HYPH|nr:cyclodeaminase [Lutibaculum baratangense]ESR24570.1 Ornithine cyclodeaminase [Lutibaculum baratangense AMV1]